MKFVLTTAAALSLLPAVVYAGLEDARYSTVLTPTNFDNVIASQSEGTLVAFFAPWCGHCKSLEPVWTQVAQAFEGDDRCKVAHLNADESSARPLSSKYGVSGFPTLKFIEPPSKGSKVESYNGARTEQALLEYLNEKCGTEKAPGGTLSKLAGRIPSLDNLAQHYFAPSSTRSELLASASSLASTLETKSSALSSYYLKVMTKYVDLAESNLEEAKSWVDREITRLGKLASRKGQIKVEKLEEAQMKKNILAVFQSAVVQATSVASQASSTVVSVATQVTDSASSVFHDASSTGSSVVAKVTDRVKEEL